MVTELWVQENEYIVLWRVFEIDTGVYLCHTRNYRDFYNGYAEKEFYISYQQGRWLTDPVQPADLVKEISAAIRSAGYR